MVDKNNALRNGMKNTRSIHRWVVMSCEETDGKGGGVVVGVRVAILI
jgi:hypothetical protein